MAALAMPSWGSCARYRRNASHSNPSCRRRDRAHAPHRRDDWHGQQGGPAFGRCSATGATRRSPEGQPISHHTHCRVASWPGLAPTSLERGSLRSRSRGHTHRSPSCSCTDKSRERALVRNTRANGIRLIRSLEACARSLLLPAIVAEAIVDEAHFDAEERIEDRALFLTELDQWRREAPI